MSLETLLEAAHYLEQRGDGKPKTRDEAGRSFHPYAKTPPPGYSSDGSNDNMGFSKFYSDLKDNVEKRRSGGAGTREVHNKLEKNRRAHLKECFDTLKYQVPSIQDKKTSNLTILRGALRYIQVLRRKEKDFEQEMQKWALEKIALQQRIQGLKSDLNKMNIEFDLDLWVSNQDQETASTSTASENGSVQLSDEEVSKSVLQTRESKLKVETSMPGESLTVTTSSSASHPKQLNAAIMTPVVPTTYRTPVTQILHQTITQRAAMQQLQMLQRQQKETADKVSTVQSSNTRTPAQIVPSVAQVRPQSGLSQAVTLQTKPPLNSHMATVSKLASAIAMPISTTPKSAGPALMPIVSKPPSSVVAIASSATTTAAASSVSQHSAKQAASLATPAVTPTVTSPAMQVGIVGNAAINQTLTASLMNHGLTNHNTITAVPTNIKQLLGTGAHLVSAGTQLSAINPLRTSTLGQMLSSVSNVGGVSIAGANQLSAVHPVVSLAHITPGSAHIMSPMSVVSPNVHVSNLSQQQINNMIQQQQPLLKSLNQLPLIQPQFLQAGQVVSQQMVKPVVLVPSGVATSSGQPAQVTMSVTRSTS
ncbi:max-binding protein MNT-like [Liolophura sinensis]|uniref:max-binding protein MNT-like n=1 Tax=Liolophura sinensis TaxID=3198878 RepID=UPI0031596C57